jgi:2'-5' RNA ligase
MAPMGGSELMDKQLELLGRDATRHNVFFAALPDAVMSANAEGTVRDARRCLGLSATPIPPERLHVSLISVGDFSGSCPHAVIDEATRAAGIVSMAPFKVEFDRVASFPGSHGQRALVLIGDVDGVADFMRLQGVLKHALMKASLRLPRQKAPCLT